MMTFCSAVACGCSRWQRRSVSRAVARWGSTTRPAIAGSARSTAGGLEALRVLERRRPRMPSEIGPTPRAADRGLQPLAHPGFGPRRISAGPPALHQGRASHEQRLRRARAVTILEKVLAAELRPLTRAQDHSAPQRPRRVARLLQLRQGSHRPSDTRQGTRGDRSTVHARWEPLDERASLRLGNRPG
jgi:hypothetical protein